MQCWAQTPSERSEEQLAEAVRGLSTLPEPKPFAHWNSFQQERSKVGAVVDRLLLRLPGPRERLYLPRATAGVSKRERELIWRQWQRSPNFAEERWIPFLPQRDEVFDAVWVEYQKAPSSGWVLVNDPRRREEMRQLAREGSKVPLMALAASDWSSTEPLLRHHLRGAKRQTALEILVTRSAFAEEAGTGLLELYDDPSLDEANRRSVTEAMLCSPWPGREGFLDRLLTDDPSVTSSSYAIGDAAAYDPEFFLPLLIRALDDPRQKVRSQAAFSLLQVPRADALAALLPWLADSEWKGLPPHARYHLLRSLENFAIERAIQDLLVLVDPTGVDALDAIRALKPYGPTVARRAFLSGLERLEAGTRLQRRWAENSDGREDWVAAGLDAGLFTVEEQIQALDWLAEQLSGGRDFSDVTKVPYCREQPLSAELVRQGAEAQVLTALTQRIDQFRNNGDERAQGLEALLPKFTSEVIDVYLLERLAEGPCDKELLVQLLERRDRFNDDRHLVKAIHKRGGYRGGLATLLLGDPGSEARCLQEGDSRAVEALLAGARYVDRRLSVSLVEQRVRRDSSLRSVAVAYLDNVESKEARQLARQLDPAPRIVGRSDPSADFSTMESAATKLIGQGTDGEVYGLGVVMTGGRNWSETKMEYHLVHVNGGTGDVHLWDDSGSRELLNTGQLLKLRLALDIVGADDLPRYRPNLFPVAHGPGPVPVVEYLHLTRQGGERVVFLPSQRRKGWVGPVSPDHDAIFAAFELLFQETRGIDDDPAWL